MVNSCATAGISNDSIQSGNKIRSSGLFTNALDDYSPVDPTVVNCTVTDPDGGQVNYIYPVGIQRDTPGEYWLELELVDVGEWYFRWWSQGNIVASTQIALRVTGVI